MTERTKRSKSKPTWSDVKSKLADFDRAGLQQLVADLYAFHRDNQTFLHARFGLGESPLEAYKQRIQVALAPDISRKRNANISVSAAKKAISEYNKAVGDPLGILELRLFWCETAVKFSMDYGYGDIGYLDALALQYSEACIVLSALDEPLLENTIERLTNIRDDAQMGYGIWDYMADTLRKALLKLPMTTVEAEIPQTGSS
ncbi:MAG: hypothetical protein L6Q40_11060 [Azonexus sp.]|jgi:hypothetical protein|nr:hypothetical protein [Azonexus sp.]